MAFPGGPDIHLPGEALKDPLPLRDDLLQVLFRVGRGKVVEDEVLALPDPEGRQDPPLPGHPFPGEAVRLENVVAPVGRLEEELLRLLMDPSAPSHPRPPAPPGAGRGPGGRNSPARSRPCSREARAPDSPPPRRCRIPSPERRSGSGPPGRPRRRPRSGRRRRTEFLPQVTRPKSDFSTAHTGSGRGELPGGQQTGPRKGKKGEQKDHAQALLHGRILARRRVRADQGVAAPSAPGSTAPPGGGEDPGGRPDGGGTFTAERSG